MKAAIVTEAGQKTPVYGDFAAPEPAAGELRVHVTAAALSPVVKGRASGAHYSASGQFPFIAGIDGVGRLDDGRRVFFFGARPPYGSMAEQAVVAETQCAALPDDLDDITAAAIANPGMSSWGACTLRAGLKPGETVLVNGATGAAGRLAVQIARHLGAGTVIATGRNTEVLQSLDADETIVLTQDEPTLDSRFEAVFARGVNVVLDYLWGRTAERLLMAGARAGAEGVPIRFVQIGSISGADITLPSAVLRASAITLLGSGLGSIPLAQLAPCIADMMHAAGGAGFTVASQAIPLSQLEQVWNAPENGRRTVFTL